MVRTYFTLFYITIVHLTAVGQQVFQPVVPFSIGKKWNLITRTIVLVISQMQVIPSSEITSSQTGLNNILFSAFLSPVNVIFLTYMRMALYFPLLDYNQQLIAHIDISTFTENIYHLGLSNERIHELTFDT